MSEQNTNNNQKSWQTQGALSKKEVRLSFKRFPSVNQAKPSIFLQFPNSEKVELLTERVVSTQRNTVIGSPGGQTVCFIEHLLGAINLLEIPAIEISLEQGEEIPLDDGSAEVWASLLADWKQHSYFSQGFPIKLDQALSVSTDGNGDDTNDHKAIFVYPAKCFMMSYLFEDPVTHDQSWVRWTEYDDKNLLLKARTFAPLSENKILGLAGTVLSFDLSGFDLPFRMPNEPAYHKLLDLFGDLCLSGFNPLQIKGHFVSIRGSHALNFSMANLIKETLNN